MTLYHDELANQQGALDVVVTSTAELSESQQKALNTKTY